MMKQGNTNLQIAVDGTRDESGGLGNHIRNACGGSGAISAANPDRSGNLCGAGSPRYRTFAGVRSRENVGSGLRKLPFGPDGLALVQPGRASFVVDPKP